MNRWCCWIGVLAVVSGCATMDIQTDYDSEYVFDRIETYGWMPDGEKRKGDPRVDNDLLDRRVRAAVDEVLAEKGWAEAAAGAAPDILIGYHAMLKDKISVKEINDHYGYRGVWSQRYWNQPGMPQAYVYEYQQGMLLLDFAEPADSQLVWRGSAQAEVDRSARPEKREQMIKKAVRKILEEFPPG